MKALSKIAVGAVVAVGLGFAAVAFAHGPGMGYGWGGGYGMGAYGGGYGMHGPYGGGGFGQGMRGPYGGYNEQTLNENLSSLKSDLKITKEQTQAWETFETAVHNQAKSVAELRATMYAAQANPEAHYAIMQQRFAGIQAVQKARADLYNVLTAEQKEVFDRPGPYGYRGYCG
jgi:LTXXQ motif family protein